MKELIKEVRYEFNNDSLLIGISKKVKAEEMKKIIVLSLLFCPKFIFSKETA
jgi:hypothetical protein